MNSTSTYALRRADDLIRSGKADLAQTILMEYLRQNPRSEHGWLLLSLAMAEPQKQIDSLRMVLRINPNNTIARSRLAQLRLDAISLREEDPAHAHPKLKQTAVSESDTGLLSDNPANLPTHAAPSRLTEGMVVRQPLRPFQALPAEIKGVRRSTSPLLDKVELVSSLSRRKPELMVMIIGTGLVLLVVLVALISMAGIKNYQQVSVYNTQVSFQATYQAQQILPATWTFTPSPDGTPTPAFSPTPRIALTATPGSFLLAR